MQRGLAAATLSDWATMLSDSARGQDLTRIEVILDEMSFILIHIGLAFRNSSDYYRCRTECHQASADCVECAKLVYAVATGCSEYLRSRLIRTSWQQRNDHVRFNWHVVESGRG